jgi:hypothetical protein
VDKSAIERYSKDTRCEDVKWIHLAQGTSDAVTTEHGKARWRIFELRDNQLPKKYPHHEVIGGNISTRLKRRLSN